ncbi:MAG: chemotaxis protein CheW [Desulfuromonadales bacterium]|nr:chemotaxis protein CheW [Desulfuromonadales bacterium]
MHEESHYEIDRILEEMRTDYWRNLEVVAEDAEETWSEYLIVRIGDKPYGLPATGCREVLKLPHLVRVPRLPVHLRGVFNLRGEIIAVTDLRPLLGHQVEEVVSGARLVVVESSEVRTALLVDAVEGLSRVDDERVEPLAEGAAQGVRDLVRGKLIEDDKVLVLIDLQRLLVRPDMVVDQKKQD